MQEETDSGLAWQIGVWDRMADVYDEMDRRFEPLVERLLARAGLRSGEAALDLGTGTGSVALSAAAQVGPSGAVTAVDISPEMLERARARASAAGLGNLSLREGRAESIPCPDGSQDAVLASLSLMYVVDRAGAAREIARVLRPGGRFVAAVWGGADACDIVRFQETAGSFAPAPPVPGVGPGALADPSRFLSQLESAGLTATVAREVTEFRFETFEEAWSALAGVTTAGLAHETVLLAQTAVQERMWSRGEGPRAFRNETQFLAATKR